MPKGIKHKNVGTTLTYDEFHAEDAHEVAEGTQFPANPSNGDLFIRTDLRTVFRYNGTSWVPLLPAGTVILLYNDEADSTEITNTTSETDLKSWTLPPNSYAKIIIESDVRGRVEQDASTRCDFTFRVYEGTTVRKTVTTRIIALSTTGADSGDRTVYPIKAVISGGQTANTTLKVTGQMSLANTSTGMLAHSFRVYGVIQ